MKQIDNTNMTAGKGVYGKKLFFGNFCFSLY